LKRSPFFLEFDVESACVNGPTAFFKRTLKDYVRLCLIVGLILSYAEAFAAPVENNSELLSIVTKVKLTKEKIVEADFEKRRILGSLYSINQRMKRISREKGRLTDELFQVQYNVKNLAKIIAGLEVDIEKQKRQLRRRLRTIYKISGEGYLAIVFSRRSAADLDETLRFLRIVAENDYNLIRSYQQNVALHLREKDKLKAQLQTLVGIEARIRNKEGLLETEFRAKSKFVGELDRQRSANLHRIRAIREKTEGVDELDELLKPSIFEKKGQLQSPIAGSVIREFGLISDDRYKTRLSHKGWRFAAPRGSLVSLIFDGNVIHSDKVDGYGHTIVVDHGDHYYSVYANLSRVKLKSGDNAKRGQVIGEASAGMNGHEDGIYFEIRHFSEPENPASWIASKVVNVATTASLTGSNGEIKRDSSVAIAELARKLEQDQKSQTSGSQLEQE
jgi:septal ring factor EnvC (AmiA/AmiB activator)